MTLKREPLTIVEIDVDQCTLAYGTGACTAVLGTDGVRKCYNTFATCQDRANFDKGTLTLRFASNTAAMPKGQNVFPALVSISESPGRISLGSPDDRLGSLGKRTKIALSFSDFAYSDALTDKYYAERIDGTAQTDEGGYNPLDRGTFWAKVALRSVYLAGRSVRIKQGYAGDDIATMPSRSYVIDEWSGPSGGKFNLTVADPLTLAGNKKAVYPAPSEGRTAVDIEDTGLPTFELTPAGVGADYDASGYVNIGSEIMAYTRSSDTLTITERGAFNTEIDSHDEGDTVQMCAHFDRARIYDVVQTLLEDGAGIETGVFNYAAAKIECDRWLSIVRLDRIIPKPVGVETLLSQICDLGIVLYPDELNAEIRLKVNRPLDLGETAPELTEATNLIANSVSVKALPKQLITQVMYWHGIKDPTKSATESDNYSRLFTPINTELRSEDAANTDNIKTIYQPWLGFGGSDAFVRSIAIRFNNRYGVMQREVTFDIDVKDKDPAEIAGYVTVKTKQLPDVTGNDTPLQMQVTQRQDVDPGHRIRVTAQTYQFGGPDGDKRYGFITDNARPDYLTSSDAERTKGVYLADKTTGLLSNGDNPYRYF